jgi:DNA-3-methyladenine glycosylase II
MIASPKTLKQAAEHLSKNDSILAGVIAATGEATIKPHQNYYQELVDSIISQQLSVKAARAIEQRFCDLFESEGFPPPDKILEKTVEEMRAAGLSNAKARYVRDLAEHVLDGRLKFDNIDKLTNHEVIKELTAVKGIGEWTAHMFLMFCMGRMDVLPIGDLGIRNGVQKLYGLDHSATPEEVTNVSQANGWHPYETVASWYVWQSLDNAPK